MFHFSEYFVISISNPQSLSLDSFMLTHSLQYGLAALLSWTEFFTEVYFYPGESSHLIDYRWVLDYFKSIRLWTCRNEKVQKLLDYRLAYLPVRRNYSKNGNAHSKEKFSSHRKFCSFYFRFKNCLRTACVWRYNFNKLRITSLWWMVYTD